MTDWNKATRSEVEAAAAAGDEAAQTALLLHQMVDRIDVKIAATRAAMQDGFDRITADIEQLKREFGTQK